MEDCWTSFVRTPKIGPSDVHLWRVKVGPIASDGIIATLSPDERSRAAKFHRDADRHRFVIGRGALRRLIGDYLGVPPQTLALAYGQYGKPALLGRTGLHFNISHSGEWVLIVIARDTKLGVDVEQVKHIPDYGIISDSYFGHAERQLIASAPEQLRSQRFHECWVRKEAYLKMLGCGLTDDLATFDLFPAVPEGLFVGEKLERHLTFREVSPGASYAASLIANHPGLAVRLLTLEDLCLQGFVD